jgi:hypothetical protein
MVQTLGMSALGRKADIPKQSADVRYDPKRALRRVFTLAASLNR